ncbi:MAG TPA: SxtJ family membrane protein [Tepidisphaeraceae bacterium]|jgi:hypothetical protein|nr:SxtJ family membrane protein [Tepidisphaeraceae bacterium]
MIQLNTNPSRTELHWFGLLAAAFFAFAGVMVLRRTHSLRSAEIIWIASALLVALYYLIPPLRRPIYVASMSLTYPFGWILSHVVVVVLFYLIITPLGLLMRLLGHDPMMRTFEPGRQSYWVERDPPVSPDRYFRQS